MEGDVVIRIGNLVSHGGEVYRISHISVIGVNLESGQNVSLPVDELRPASAILTDRTPEEQADEQFDKKAWQAAEHRYSVIDKLVPAKTTRAEIEDHAQSVGISPATLYRWLRDYRVGGLAALVPHKRGWTANKRRISPETENFIKETVQTVCRLQIKRPVEQTIEICRKNGIEPPGASTIRREVDRVTKEINKSKGFSMISREAR